MANKILIDWLSFTSKIHNVEHIIELLGLEDVAWQTLKGAQGYRDRLYYDKISIHFNGRDDMGVWCEMSGQGCRAFESYGNGNYMDIFDTILFDDMSMNITRLDLAFDDFDGIFDINQLDMDTDLENFVSKFTGCEILKSIKNNQRAITIVHGSANSDVRIRIYDKAKERNKNNMHWIRLELQLRQNRALQFIKQYVIDDSNIGDLFCGVLNTYLRYVESTNDSNKRRWPLADYWAKFLTTATKIRLFEKPGTEYNLFNLEDFVVKQAGNAIAVYVDICGEEVLFDKLLHRGTRPNPKYEALRKQYEKKT